MRLIVPKFAPASDSKQLKPSLAKAAILILIISVSAFMIRIVQPIGTSILNMQLCFFASNIALFIVGIIAYRSNLFAKIRAIELEKDGLSAGSLWASSFGWRW